MTDKKTDIENEADLENLINDIEASQGTASESASSDSNDHQADTGNEVQDLRDQVLRAHAELENVRKRARRDAEERAKFANLPILKDILSSVDNMNRAIQVAESGGDEAPMLDGVKLVRDMLLETLKKYHCVPIPSVGETYDPNFHEVIQMQPNPEVEANTILVEVATGYTMHDRVIRPAQVIVSTGS